VLTRANKDFTAGNIKANAGESFLDFTKRIVDDVSKKYDPSAPQPETSGALTPAEQAELDRLRNRFPGRRPS
jgi:hypothetical protein